MYKNISSATTKVLSSLHSIISAFSKPCNSVKMTCRNFLFLKMYHLRKGLFTSRVETWNHLFSLCEENLGLINKYVIGKKKVKTHFLWVQIIFSGNRILSLGKMAYLILASIAAYLWKETHVHFGPIYWLWVQMEYQIFVLLLQDLKKKVIHHHVSWMITSGWMITYREWVGSLCLNNA